jgi:hypothetical protein
MGKVSEILPLARGGRRGFITKALNRTDQKLKRKALRSNMPLAEFILWGKLKGGQLDGYKFRRQYSVEDFIIDSNNLNVRDYLSHFKFQIFLARFLRFFLISSG